MPSNVFLINMMEEDSVCRLEIKDNFDYVASLHPDTTMQDTTQNLLLLQGFPFYLSTINWIGYEFQL
jgi:hypothetical protein